MASENDRLHTNSQVSQSARRRRFHVVPIKGTSAFVTGVFSIFLSFKSCSFFTWINQGTSCGMKCKLNWLEENFRILLYSLLQFLWTTKNNHSFGKRIKAFRCGWKIIFVGIVRCDPGAQGMHCLKILLHPSCSFALAWVCVEACTTVLVRYVSCQSKGASLINSLASPRSPRIFLAANQWQRDGNWLESSERATRILQQPQDRLY